MEAASKTRTRNRDHSEHVRLRRVQYPGASVQGVVHEMRLSSGRNEWHGTALCKRLGRGELAVRDSELSARAMGAAEATGPHLVADSGRPPDRHRASSSIRRLITPLSLPNPTPRVFAGS